ncbi:hypothetical protein [Rhodobacter lacus]|uniref:50S ribosomal protein L35 n=1 Tax=Rhodobacter lacus TaxID=1641972 RepID=A0ABW5AAN3_9RHOB
MLDADIYLVLGIIVSAFAIPGVLSAFAESRPPRSAAVAVLVGGGLILYAFATRPGGYTPAQIPEAFTRVLAEILGR